jgi:hypothetical protein
MNLVERIEHNARQDVAQFSLAQTAEEAAFREGRLSGLSTALYWLTGEEDAENRWLPRRKRKLRFAAMQEP